MTKIFLICKCLLPSLQSCTKYLEQTQPAITSSKLTIETLEQRCEICSKVTIKTPKRRHWRRFGVFIVNFEHISHLCSSVSTVKLEQVNASWEAYNFKAG